MTLPDIEKDMLISKLYAKVHSLEKQLKKTRRRSPSPMSDHLDPDVSTDMLQIQNNIYKKRKSAKRSSSSRNMVLYLDLYCSRFFFLFSRQ